MCVCAYGHGSAYDAMQESCGSFEVTQAEGGPMLHVELLQCALRFCRLHLCSEMLTSRWFGLKVPQSQCAVRQTRTVQQDLAPQLLEDAPKGFATLCFGSSALALEKQAVDELRAKEPRGWTLCLFRDPKGCDEFEIR